MQESYDNIKGAIDKLLSIKSNVKRKRQSKQVQHRELFINVINSLQMLQNRANLLYTELKVDFNNYDEPFLEVIDALLLLRYGKDACEVIFFYLWERENPDGTMNELLDENGNIIPLETAQDLWNIVLRLNPNVSE